MHVVTSLLVLQSNMARFTHSVTAAEKVALKKEKNAKLMSERARLRSNKLMTKAMSSNIGADEDTNSDSSNNLTLPAEQQRISMQRRQSLTADALAAKKEADRLKREAKKLEESTKATRRMVISASQAHPPTVLPACSLQC